MTATVGGVGALGRSGTSTERSSEHQGYLPDEILEEAGVEGGRSSVVRVRDHAIELIPAEIAERAIDAGLENLRRASLDTLTEAWENPEDEAWNEA